MRFNFKKFISIALISCVILSITIFGVRITRPNYEQKITLRSLPFNTENPDQKRLGPLKFLAAWELTSDNPDFGGISAINILDDGRFLGVSDAGTLIGFGINGNEVADRPFIAPLPGSQGEGLTFADRDSEAIAHDPDTGRFWVGYENSNAVRRFSRSFARTDKFVKPPLMQNWSPNSGAEAMARMKDGRFIIFSEGYDLPDGSYEAILFSGDPTLAGTAAASFGYFPPDGYKVTDAAQLPNGNILILHRRVSFPIGFSVKLGVLDPDTIISGESVRSEIIATLESPLLVDNLEGITIANENGKTIIWMISDNNFFIFQRTLLMKFELSLSKIKQQDIKKPDEEIAPGFESL